MDSLALFSIGNVINAFLMGILEAPYINKRHTTWRMWDASFDRQQVSISELAQISVGKSMAEVRFQFTIFSIPGLPVSPGVLFPHFPQWMETHMRQHMLSLTIMSRLYFPWSLELTSS